MKEEWRSIKIKPILGDLPEMGATDWWTKEQWDEHNAYVEKLKAEGKYLTEGEEVTINYRPKDFEMFVDKTPLEKRFTNFGIIIPMGNDSEPPKINYEQPKTKT